jgi:hypothetical protein
LDLHLADVLFDVILSSVLESWDLSVSLYEPCVLYIGRSYRYPPNVAFYIYFQQINVLSILNML